MMTTKCQQWLSLGGRIGGRGSFSFIFSLYLPELENIHILFKIKTTLKNFFNVKKKSMPLATQNRIPRLTLLSQQGLLVSPPKGE